MGHLGHYDLLVIGGGVNGAGIARDAAGRGLSVLLCEQFDLASGTSSASTKLVHGGLRYLEQYEFRLVREALKERETLLRAAPHIIWPLRFVLPHHSALRPRWMLRAGLFIYDHIGGRGRLPPTSRVSLREDPRGAPLKASFTHGFEYADCWVEDARLVALNAVCAAEHGAIIMVRTKVASLAAAEDGWTARLEPDGSTPFDVRARVVVNTAGPWVDHVLRRIVRRNEDPKFALRLVKGSHIILDRLYDGEHAYILQNADGRIIFTIPYEGKFTLVGTTDIPFSGDPADATATDDEIDYLCSAASEYFARPITRAMVRRTYSGVRPLHDDASSKSASAVTRDYVFDISGAPPILSVYGGKITTYRRLAEHALEKLRPYLGSVGKPWTADAPLPGGDMPDANFDSFLVSFKSAFAWLTDATALRLARAYGTRASRFLDGAKTMADLGTEFGAGLTQAEIGYLQTVEFARTPDDILWRRSKLALHLDDAAIEAVRRSL